MSKHNRILDSWKEYNENNIPVYHVIKTNKYGTFEGIVVPCEQDYENINDWDGYRFAERKCDIKIAHAKARILKERAQGILNIYKTLKTKYEASKNYEGLVVIEDIYYQYKLAQKEYQKIYTQYKYMRDSFSDYTSRMIERRKQVNERLNEKRAAELQD